MLLIFISYLAGVQFGFSFNFHLEFVGWFGCGVFQKGPPVIPESMNWPIREYLVPASILFTLQLIACPSYWCIAH